MLRKVRGYRTRGVNRDPSSRRSPRRRGGARRRNGVAQKRRKRGARRAYDNAEPLLPSSATGRRSDLLVIEREDLTVRNDAKKNIYLRIGSMHWDFAATF